MLCNRVVILILKVNAVKVVETGLSYEMAPDGKCNKYKYVYKNQNQLS